MKTLTAPRAPMPAVPVASTASDSEILSAFARWKDAHAVREALPDTDNPSKENPLITVEEQAQWTIIDRAEQEIASLPAKTPAGVACKLWLAIAHDVETPAPCEAAFRADLNYFVANARSLDWNVLCIVSALVALKTMEG